MFSISTSDMDAIELTRKGFISNYPPFRRWKASDKNDLLSNKPINIYIHVPFCTHKCLYCYYMTELVTSKHQIEDFAVALSQEIKIAVDMFNLKGRSVKTIYMGGGTPTLLSSNHLRSIFQILNECLDIDKPEITIECEPITLTKNKYHKMKDLGANRISLGVQSFSDNILALIERKHTKKKALNAIEVGLSSKDITLNIDLLSGLPGETMTSWIATLETSIQANIPSITIYKMETYSNTNIFDKSIRKKKLHIPSDEDERQFMEHALHALLEANYVPWSFFTFTKNGIYRHIHSPSVWSGEDLIAFGPSAFGFIDNYSYQNTNNMGRYYTCIKNGILPINRAHKQSSIDLMIKDLLLGMKLLTIDIEAFEAKHGINLIAVLDRVVEQLEHNGCINIDGRNLTMTNKGILYGDYIGKVLAAQLCGLFKSVLIT